jgi:beta-lactamase class A
MSLFFPTDPALSRGFEAVISKTSRPDLVRACLLDISHRRPRFAGHNEDLFCYTASLPKVFVDLGAAWQVHSDPRKPDELITVSEKNVRPFDAENCTDGTPTPLEEGEVVTFECLRSRMIEWSCDTSANQLVDFLGRESINTLIAKMGWKGSEFRRKFLPRDRDDPPYNDPKTPTTYSCAKHLMEFMFHVYIGSLVSTKQSGLIFERLSRQHDKTKLAKVLPASAHFAHKTGWLYSPNIHPSVWCQADCGIVKDDRIHYIVCVIVNELPKDEAISIIHEVGRGIHNLF